MLRLFQKYPIINNEINNFLSLEKQIELQTKQANDNNILRISINLIIKLKEFIFEMNNNNYNNRNISILINSKRDSIMEDIREFKKLEESLLFGNFFEINVQYDAMEFVVAFNNVFMIVSSYFKEQIKYSIEDIEQINQESTFTNSDLFIPCLLKTILTNDPCNCVTTVYTKEYNNILLINYNGKDLTVSTNNITVVNKINEMVSVNDTVDINFCSQANCNSGSLYQEPEELKNLIGQIEEITGASGFNPNDEVYKQLIELKNVVTNNYLNDRNRPLFKHLRKTYYQLPGYI